MITFQNESRSQVDEALQTNQDFMFGAGAFNVIRRSKSNPFDPLANNRGYSYDIRLDSSQPPGVSTAVDYARNGEIDKYKDDSDKGWFLGAFFCSASCCCKSD